MNKTDAVLAHLKKNRSITSWEAITLYRATRLADIIFKLRCKGLNISTELIETEKSRFARYRLAKHWFRFDFDRSDPIQPAFAKSVERI